MSNLRTHPTGRTTVTDLSGLGRPTHLRPADHTDQLAARLQAAGYTVTQVCATTVMVGGVDPVALLDAQIAALTAQRDALVDARRASELEGAMGAMGGPF